MDKQLKRGILEICVLKALVQRDSYGYQIIKDISPYVAVSESTLYPILKRLETGGFITARAAEYNGRLRRYYKITPLGLAKFKSGKDDLQEIQSIYQAIFGGRV